MLRERREYVLQLSAPRWPELRPCKRTSPSGRPRQSNSPETDTTQQQVWVPIDIYSCVMCFYCDVTIFVSYTGWFIFYCTTVCGLWNGAPQGGLVIWSPAVVFTSTNFWCPKHVWSQKHKWFHGQMWAFEGRLVWTWFNLPPTAAHCPRNLTEVM